MQWLIETTKGYAGVNETTAQWWLIPSDKAATAADAIRYVGASPEQSFATLGNYISEVEEGTAVDLPVEAE